MTKQSQHSQEETKDWILSNVRTLDATGGIKDFPDYDYLWELLRQLCGHRILIIAKSRQMMATWMLCAWIVYLLIHDEPGIYLLLSKGKRETEELIKRLKVIIQSLPQSDLNLALGLKIKTSEVVAENGGRIIALPATRDVVRMHSPTVVFWDEMAFTPYSEDIWTTVKPAIDSGGCFYGVSTPNGTDNFFFQLLSEEDNGFARHLMHWKLHPERDAGWEAAARRGLSDARWRQEYEIDFQVMENRVYSEFDPDLHVVEAGFEWRKSRGNIIRGIDFGYRHPFIIWAKVFQDGSILVFDEWEGCDATVDDMLLAIAEVNRRNGLDESQVYFSGVDPAGAAASDSGISPVDRLKRQGLQLLWRSSLIMTGVEMIKSLLKDATGRVRLRISENAPRLIHHLKHYQWDTAGALPLKDNRHDHAVDALRYMVINLKNPRNADWSGVQVRGMRR